MSRSWFVKSAVIAGLLLGGVGLLMAAIRTIVRCCGPAETGTLMRDLDSLRETETSLINHVRVLAREIGKGDVFQPEKLRKAPDYITTAWKEIGYQVNSQLFTVRGVECANLEAVSSGGEAVEDLVKVEAYYDSAIHCSGANDNATGVVALLEISTRRLARTGKRSLYES